MNKKCQKPDGERIERDRSVDTELENSLRQIPQPDAPERLLASLLDDLPDGIGKANQSELMNPLLPTGGAVGSNWRWMAFTGVAASLLLLVVTWAASSRSDEAVGKAVAEPSVKRVGEPDAASNSIALFRETDPCNILPPFAR